jgi:L-serine deaminase
MTPTPTRCFCSQGKKRRSSAHHRLFDRRRTDQNVTEINGFPLELTGDFAALVTLHQDRPGVIHSVTGVLAARAVNIAEMRVSRRKRGSTAVMVIDVDGAVPDEVVNEVQKSCR